MPAGKKPNPSRAPIGVLTAKPIALRLMPDERARLEQVAQAEGRSLASQARMFVLAGLSAHHKSV